MSSETERARRRAYERRTYHATMERIRKAPGSSCALESEDCDGQLQVDHPNGRDWEMNLVSSVRRAKRLEQELSSGVTLRLLCAYHNGWHGSTFIQPHMRGVKKLRAQRRATRNP